MPLHKDFIKKSVKESIKKHGSSVQPEELEKILTATIYDIFIPVILKTLSKN